MPRPCFELLLAKTLVTFIARCFRTVDPGQVFRPNWHIEAIAHELEQVLRGKNQRLIINIPPRNLKSICASVAFPAFALGFDPTLRILCVSYSIELAAKHSRDCRAVMESPWYKEAFPKTRLSPKRNTELEFETTARGSRLATSVGGTLTGRGGNLIIIDDPLKPEDAQSETRRATVNAWFDSTLSSRLDQKTEDSIVIVMQRLHCDDLVGHVLERDRSWRVLKLPAIAEEPAVIDLGHGLVHRREVGDVLHPAREPRVILEQVKLQQSSLTFSAQYQQAPVPPGGALIQEKWFRRYGRRPEPESGDQIIQSWDIASKTGANNDYTVCTTWLHRGTDLYLLHVLRERLEYPDLLRRVVAYRKEYRPRKVLIEDAGTGTPLIQDVNRNGGFRAEAIQPVRDKLVRLDAVTDLIEGGYVILPESASWLGEFMAEILAFPNGRHDDQIDSLSQFLAWTKRPRPKVHVG
ncbi:MAG: phage terminase large subunit [Deltaproteobacteria bacterium]|nr:phage terminase large subunit [Deltaproteobacteria bacterium]